MFNFIPDTEEQIRMTFAITAAVLAVAAIAAWAAWRFQKRRAADKAAAQAKFEERQAVQQEYADFLDNDELLLDPDACEAIKLKMQMIGIYPDGLSGAISAAERRRDFKELFAGDLTLESFPAAMKAYESLSRKGCEPIYNEHLRARVRLIEYAPEWLELQLARVRSYGPTARAEAYTALKWFFTETFHIVSSGGWDDFYTSDTAYEWLQERGVSFNDADLLPRWYRIVGELERTPVLKDFAGISLKFKNGEFLTRMAELIAHPSSWETWEGKLALAICAHHERFRVEAGEFREQLALLVEARESQRARQ